jgi:predicted RNA-binding Zn ribbon-like protein
VSPRELGRVRALFLAGHLALDFVNTRMRVGDSLVDLLQSDDDVLIWFKQAGLATPTIGDEPKPLNLLRSARMLRKDVRSLIENRKGGGRGDPSVLNKFLAAGCSYSQLVWSKPSKLRVETVRRQESAESIFVSVAEAAVDLLTMHDFNLVKRCEDPTCVYWFLDQTKSHRRRWCSMELCGNRHKVAAYRARRRHEGSSRE